MGTSANRNRIKPGTPLIPDWIPTSEQPDTDNDPNESGAASDQQSSEGTDDHEPSETSHTQEDQVVNRFLQSQLGFRSAVRSRPIDRGLLRRVVKNYVSRSGGGPRTMARRMQRSSGAIVRLGNLLHNIQRTGLATELRRLRLEAYIGRPALEVLSALMNEVCGAGALLDDAVTTQAYANTVTRIDMENANMDLNALDSAQIAEMLAIFLEETIVYRIISDVGRSLTVVTSDVEQSRQIELNLYQVVNGLVHSVVVPRLQNAFQDLSSLRQQMDSIYEIAFSTLVI